MEEIKITRAQTLKEKPDPSTLVFGKAMTDHMFIVDYDAGQGWHDPRIVPYGPLAIDPAAKVLHYAQEIFEGLKAYRTADGSIQLFRPLDNVRRMNNSAARMSLPQIPEELALAGITELEAGAGLGALCEGYLPVHPPLHGGPGRRSGRT